MQTPVTTDRSFGAINFEAAQLGDERRTRRLVQLADSISRHPGGTLPDKLKSPADLKALYRLCNRPEVTHEAVLAPHRAVTLERIRQETRTLLVLHDTTNLDYTSKTTLSGLGQIGNGGGRGYLCHNSLVVEPDTCEVLGLASQILHRRVEGIGHESRKQRRERSSRESRLWLQGTVGLPGAWNLVDVCDRGADTFEFLEQEVRSGRRFVIRSSQNRRVQTQRGSQLLCAVIGQQAACAERTLEIAGHPGRKKRTAHLQIASLAVTLLPPDKKQGQHGRKPLNVWLVRVWENQPPQGEDPLEWRLLTNEPVHTPDDAQRVVAWYERRWVIEEYHKAKKTGCGIETLQFTAEERLQPAIALLSVVALTLLNLRAAARCADATTRPATQIVSSDYVELLSAWRYNEVRPMTIHEFFYALARLGGHQNRRHDKRPGWLVLWRGWTTLQNMLTGAMAAKRKRCG